MELTIPLTIFYQKFVVFLFHLLKLPFNRLKHYTKLYICFLIFFVKKKIRKPFFLRTWTRGFSCESIDIRRVSILFWNCRFFSVSPDIACPCFSSSYKHACSGVTVVYDIEIIRMKHSACFMKPITILMMSKCVWIYFHLHLLALNPKGSFPPPYIFSQWLKTPKGSNWISPEKIMKEQCSVYILHTKMHFFLRPKNYAWYSKTQYSSHKKEKFLHLAHYDWCSD